MAIGLKLKAGTNCGSCIPELKRLIAQAGVAGVGDQQRNWRPRIERPQAAYLRR